mmetsp:Transcript_4432/g.6278  ORF Transcript_4432/g.6278 Transcript_4432/m.6278 type:complete len:222 (-) Transcript_4432:405-1070(-)
MLRIGLRPFGQEVGVGFIGVVVLVQCSEARSLLKLIDPTDTGHASQSPTILWSHAVVVSAGDVSTVRDIDVGLGMFWVFVHNNRSGRVKVVNGCSLHAGTWLKLMDKFPRRAVRRGRLVKRHGGIGILGKASVAVQMSRMLLPFTPRSWVLVVLARIPMSSEHGRPRIGTPERILPLVSGTALTRLLLRVRLLNRNVIRCLLEPRRIEKRRDPSVTEHLSA